MNFQRYWLSPPYDLRIQEGWEHLFTRDGRHFVRPYYPTHQVSQWPPWPGQQQQWPPFPPGGQQQQWPPFPPGGQFPPGLYPVFPISPEFWGGTPRPVGEQPRKRLRQAPQRLNLSDLEEDAKDCPICYEAYYTPNSDDEMETPVKTQCGHVYGSKCLDKWIQDHDSCPSCRRKFDLVFEGAPRW